MKTIIFKLYAFVLLLGLMGAGCEKEAKTSNDVYILVDNIIVEVGNNNWQMVNSEDLIWWFKIIDEKEKLNLSREYLVPESLPKEFKVSGLKVVISGKVFLEKFSSLAQSDPYIKLAPGYVFEIRTINKVI